MKPKHLHIMAVRDGDSTNQALVALREAHDRASKEHRIDIVDALLKAEIRQGDRVRTAMPDEEGVLLGLKQIQSLYDRYDNFHFEIQGDDGQRYYSAYIRKVDE